MGCLRPTLGFIASALLGLIAGALAVSPARADDHLTAALAARHHASQQIEPGRLPEYLSVRGATAGKRVQGDVDSVMRFPFESVRRLLSDPSSWCEITPLHLNVKSCTFSATALSLYAGRKFYQAPNESRRVDMNFSIDVSTDEVISVSLAAERGMINTRDNLIRVSAMALPPDPNGAPRTFVHLHYAYRQGVWARMATASYLSTLGRRKIGFSTEGVGRDGRPAPVQGVRGAIERNAVRYHLAVQAVLESAEAPETERFERQIGRWFSLTEHYTAQLFELERGEYLLAKRRERLHQRELQALRNGIAEPESRVTAIAR